MRNSRDTFRMAAYIRAVKRPLTLTGRRTVAIIPASSSERIQRSIVRGASPVFSAKRRTDTCAVLSYLLMNFRITWITAWQLIMWSCRIALRVSACAKRRLVHRRPRLVSDGNLSGVLNAHAALRCMFAICGCGWHSFKNRSQFILSSLFPCGHYTANGGGCQVFGVVGGGVIQCERKRAVSLFP